MKLKVNRTNRARIDIVEIATFVGQGGDHISNRFFESIEHNIEQLSEFPELGRIREIGNAQLQGMRSIPVTEFGNYLIFYIPTDTAIEIIRVLHGARDLESIFDE